MPVEHGLIDHVHITHITCYNVAPAVCLIQNYFIYHFPLSKKLKCFLLFIWPLWALASIKSLILLHAAPALSMVLQYIA